MYGMCLLAVMCITDFVSDIRYHVRIIQDAVM